MLRGQSIFPIPPAYSSQYQPYILAQSAVAVSAPVDTTEDTLATIPVPANAMGANGILRISTLWSFTNNANSKTTRVRFSGGAGTIINGNTNNSVPTQDSLHTIKNRGVTNSQVGSMFGVVGAPGSTFAIISGPTAIAADTAAATTIVITGQKATSTDTLTLESYCVEVLFGA
jgi:hypothetical protein